MTAVVERCDGTSTASALATIDLVNAQSDHIISWTVGSKLFVAKKG